MNGQETDKTLLIGIGNSAREDDGLGWAFVERVEQEGLFSGDCLYRFQLNLEDAELIAKYKQVVFIDAHKSNLTNGFQLHECQANAEAGFSTHQLAPECVLYLCQQLYNTHPVALILGIQGYRWELNEGLSSKAQQNLQKAITWFQSEFADTVNLPRRDKRYSV